MPGISCVDRTVEVCFGLFSLAKMQEADSIEGGPLVKTEGFLRPLAVRARL